MTGNHRYPLDVRAMFCLFLVAGSLVAVTIDPTDPFVVGLASSVFTGGMFLLIDRLQFPPRRTWLFVRSKLRYRRRFVRVSISYMFRIKVGDDYLLIRGVRRPGQYQPIGGVFKHLSDAVEIFKRLGVEDDDCIPVDAISTNDLRVRVQGRNLVRFLNWFDSGRGRESSPWREFYEELVRPGHVSTAAFPHIDYRYLGRRESKVRWVPEYRRFELKVAEIYELMPSPKQLEELTALQDRSREAPVRDLLWATQEEIERRGTVPHREPNPKIAEVAAWVT